MYNYDNIRKTIESIHTGEVFDMTCYWSRHNCPSCIAGHAVHAAKADLVSPPGEHVFGPTGHTAMLVLGLSLDEARVLFSASNKWGREEALAELEKLLATEPKPDLNELFGLNNAPSKNEQITPVSEAVYALQYA